MKNVLLVICLFMTICARAVVAPITGSLAFCTGSTTALASATPGGIWSSSSAVVATVGSTSGIVTGVSAGTANITYTVGPETAIAIVTVNPSPSAISGTLSSCIGSSGTLSNATPGGTWSSGTPGIGVIGAVTGIVTGVSPGTTTITYTLSSTGCRTIASYTVSPLPSAISGTTAVCAGSTGMLYNSVPGGTWTCSDPAIASVSMSSGSVMGWSVGTANISYTLSAGCFATATLTITAAATPIIGTPTVCSGLPTTFSNATAGGTWTSSSTAIATVGASSGVVTGYSSGMTLITYAISAGCYDTAWVTVSSAVCSGMPVAGATIASAPSLCSGGSSIMSLSGATTACGITYQWQSSPDGSTWTNIPAATGNLYAVTPATTLFYKATLTCTPSGLSAASSPVSVTVGSAFSAHTVVGDTSCSVSHFYIHSCSTASSYTCTTWFGDGTSFSGALSAGGIANVYHSYAMSGTYTVKHVLYSSGSPIDSVSFPFVYLQCQSIAINLYNDLNSNCVFDSGDQLNTIPALVKIDTNGVPMDTITCTSGFYRNIYAISGTVCRMSVLPMTGGRVVACPSTGFIYDTIGASIGGTIKYFGITCGATPVFDLGVSVAKMCGRHTDRTVATLSNNSCFAVTPVLTMICSNKYGITSSVYPTPTSVSGNVLTWTLPTLAAGATSAITIHRERPGGSATWLIPGDTVQTTIRVAPTAGDGDTSNNIVVRCDTVKSSFDPNHIAVSLEGNILPCTKLQYTVDFENDGNDTAHNIHVLDTLSSALDVTSLEPVIASAAMNISIITSGPYKIAKFDFPNIKLLDSSHHNLCNGMFVFNINVKPGLTDGTGIMNRVGIYFDDNPVIMTNEVNNTIGISPIIGPSSVCVGDSIAMTNATPSGVWSTSSLSVSTMAASWGRWVKGVSAGTGTVSYTVSNVCTSRTATKLVSVNSVPSVAAISGTGTVCIGAITSLASATTGGTWSSTAGATATISSAGLVSAIAAGTSTISYLVTNTCGSSAATTIVTVTAPVMPSVASLASPGTTVCVGMPVTFTPAPIYGGSAPVYIWRKNGVVAATGATFSFMPVTGDVVKCTLVSNYSCRSADTVSASDVTMSVDPVYIPAISLSATPGLYITAGESVTLTAAVTSGGPSPTYQWYLNAAPISGATTSTYTSSTFVDHDSVTCAVIGSGACHVSSFNSVVIQVGSSVSSLIEGATLSLYPNPGPGTFVIKGTVTNSLDKLSFQVHNVLGQVIYTGAAEVVAGKVSHTFTLPAELPGGSYALITSVGNAIYFVVSR